VAPIHPQRLLPALVLAVALVHPTAAGAPLSERVTGQLDVASEYLDRGVILTNQPVLQPSLTIGLPVGGGSVTIGGWATVQPASYTGNQYFSMAANTFDVVNTVTLTRLPFSPGLMVAYDMGAINGAYLEGRARQSVPFTKAEAIEVGARAGSQAP
jgi:hypothetical protein